LTTGLAPHAAGITICLGAATFLAVVFLRLVICIGEQGLL
jgi:hypothetical protein